MSELDGEEKEILDAFDEGELRRSDNFHERIDQHKQCAESVLKNDAGTFRKYLKGGVEKSR